MLSLFRVLTLRYLLQKWDRAALVALSIALGVATLVSARLLNQCVETAAYDSMTPVDIADLYVGNGEIGVEWGIATALKTADVPGLSRVELRIFERVVLPDLEDRTAMLIGIDIGDARASDAAAAKELKITLTPVNLLAIAGRPVVMSRRLYEARKRLGKRDTDPVELRYTNVTESFHLFGVVDMAKDSPLAPFADSMIGMDVRTAAKLIRRPGAGPAGPADATGDRLSRVDLFIDNKKDVPLVRERVEAIVGSLAQVRTKDENRKSTEDVIGGIKIILNLCSLGALVVGLFLVYNALSVTVAERRHDIGVMRSLGATRPQIARLFSVEAMLLGAIGALPGIPLGVGLANLALSLFGNELNTLSLSGAAPKPHLSWLTAAVAVGAGMLTALLAALVPALQSASDEPADAVRRAHATAGRRLRFVHRAACISLVSVGLAVVLLRGLLPSPTGSMVGMVCILTGLFLAMPIFVGLLARLLNPLARVTLGVEARLASDNLIRAPGRTGVVIGALAAGVSLMFQTAGVGRSNEIPIREWLDQVIRADAFVFWGNLASANSSLTPMDPKVADEIRQLPGVESVVGLRFYRPEYNGTLILVIAIDAVEYHRSIRARQPDGLPALEEFQKLRSGNSAVVSDNFADKWGVKPGETISIAGPKGPVDLTVLGRGQDYSWSKGTVFIDRAKYVELFDDIFVDTVHVFFKPDADPAETIETLKQYTEKRSLLVQDRASVRGYLAGVIDRLFRVAYLQQFVVGVVAALGVVTALLISILQRRRELGLLRAVGATQMQVLKSVLAEAMLMGLLGTILGFALGVPMEWFLLKVVLREESGFVFDLIIPWQEAAGIGLAAIVTATFAGLIPALHAVRQRITDAIAYE